MRSKYWEERTKWYLTSHAIIEEWVLDGAQSRATLKIVGVEKPRTDVMARVSRYLQAYGLNILSSTDTEDGMLVALQTDTGTTVINKLKEVAGTRKDSVLIPVRVGTISLSELVLRLLATYLPPPIGKRFSHLQGYSVQNMMVVYYTNTTDELQS